VLLCQTALLDYSGVEEELAISAFNYLFFNGAFCEETEYLDRFGLPYAVGAIL